MKMMYVHAVQSLIWNFLASERISLGKSLIIGDLVMDETSSVISIENPDQFSLYSFEDVVIPLPGFDIKYPANLLGKLEKFIESLFGDEITLFSFGKDCKIGKLAGAYRKLISKPVDLSFEIINYSDPTETILKSKLDLNNSQRPNPENQKPNSGNPKSSSDNKEEASDCDPLAKKLKPASYLGLKIEFSLPSSNYATMALREILRVDTSTTFQRTLTHQ